MSSAVREFVPLKIAVLTVSDTRGFAEDTSGQLLVDSLVEAGHQLADRALVRDDIYQIRAVVSQWIADAGVQVVLVTGGTGFTTRDSTPGAPVGAYSAGRSATSRSVAASNTLMPPGV